MRIWRYTPLDSILFLFSVFQFILTIGLAFYWDCFSFPIKIGVFGLQVFMITYNIIVVSHLFTHTPWFNSPLLNSIVSILNTVNIRQSVLIYHLKHVRNHHLYNNDQKGLDGKTKDLSSTFQEGDNNNHASLFQYALGGSAASFKGFLKDFFCLPFRFWRLDKREDETFQLLSSVLKKRKNELRQIQLDRAALFLSIIFFLCISWKWTLVCYLPSFYLALSLVNIQNYYEHYGANPKNKAENSVSYYGKMYNFLTFNDGYHQEHHLSWGAHWRLMPEVLKNNKGDLQGVQRIISPVPAIIGFLDRKRLMLHDPIVSSENNTSKKNIIKDYVYD